MPLETGARIGPYEIVSAIGAGGRLQGLLGREAATRQCAQR
jgi:hypothetical protein